MSLTRKMLAAMNIEDPQIEQIIEAHAETVSALKAKIADAEEKAEGMDELKKKLEKAEQNAGNGSNDELQGKYDTLSDEYEKFKAQVENEKVNADKAAKYKAILRDLGIDEKRIDTVMKVTDVTSFEIEGETLKDVDKLKETAQTEWAEFIPSVTTNGAGTQTPPKGGNDGDLSKLSDDEALKLMRERGY